MVPHMPDIPRPATSGPLRLRDFRLLLAGAAAGQLGAQVTLVALPLVAVLELDAPAFQVGLLTAAETAAFLLVGLPAGAWVDRMRKLPLMIRADVVRALTMASIPLAAVTGVLTMAQLYVVALVTGVATVFFDIAHQSFLPQLLPKDQLVSGNGALETIRSSAQVAGPGIGGGLVQLLGAALAIVTDAAGYALSALFLWRIKKPESLPERRPDASLRRDIGEGLRFVCGHRLLRVIAVTTGLGNFFAAVLMATQSVFLVRVLGLVPGVVGLVLAASALGGLAGALCAGRLAARFGQARLIWLSPLVTGPFAVLWPLSGRGAGAALFALGSGVVFFGVVLYNVAQVSFRQTVCPPRLLGRMNATLRFLMWGTLPLGALAGGALADAFGARVALVWCAAGFLAVPLPLLFSPLRRMRDLPATGPAEDPDTDPSGSAGAAEPAALG
ncbi:Predicted arabinose efflux permease, MFS family [Streptomyces sp. KS_16]|nr:putative MFS family arabinose efflux permease [Streptomyces sp. 2321.6]SDQ70549.1 Predicted arabinose efflux permease, MFS family [Streptomyces sp. KS_16]SEE11156.1 Predicted arabinose efflux permease, MFS family [Streptomyces sp. 2133.1]SNC74018.1 Predicted arabinose efflux permease, MFS family [Streptomyces sp. 2114.4]